MKFLTPLLPLALWAVGVSGFSPSTPQLLSPTASSPAAPQSVSCQPRLRVPASTGLRGLRAQELGGGGLKNLGGDPSTYYARLKSRQAEIEAGINVTVSPNSEVMNLISEDEDALFQMLESDDVTEVQFSENKDGAQVQEEDEEDDSELERALLEMFMEQGDVDPNAIEQEGKNVVTLDIPLDINQSKELLNAMNKMQDIEQEIREEVAEEAKTGDLKAGGEIKETFKLD